MPYVVDDAFINQPALRVWMELKALLSPPIPRETLPADAVLANVAVFRRRTGTNLALTSEQAAAIHKIIASSERPNIIMPLFSGLVTALRKEGLSFSEETLSNYLLALQTKRFVIFSGISGTGKTQLALAVAKFFRKKVQVNTRSDAPNTAIRMIALPYHFKFHRIVLPVELLRKMRIAAFEPGKTSGPID